MRVAMGRRRVWDWVVGRILVPPLGRFDASASQKWTSEHLEWADNLEHAVRWPDRYPDFVEAIADAIKGEASKH